MKIVNLTPHTLSLQGLGGTLTIPPSGMVARVAQTDSFAGSVEVDGVALPCHEKTFGGVEGLPQPEEGVIFVVSGLVASALQGSRPDVWAPGALIRDENGQPIGAQGLSR